MAQGYSAVATMATAHTPLDEPGHAPGSKPLRVLVVEDSPDTADSYALLLGLYGHEVQTAPDGPAALAKAPAFRPEVVLLDICLPGIDGWKVAERLRGQGGDRRPFLIAVTGRGMEADRHRSQQAGVDLHLTKPVEPDYLRDVLERLRRILR